MLYSILCYESEALAAGRTKQEDDAMMVRLGGVLQQLKTERKLGPVARLMPTTTATHIRSGKEPATGVPVIDGPFAETKELVAGFWIWQVKSQEEAIEWVKRCPNPMGLDIGSEIEIRQIFEMEDFGAELTPELREQETRLRAQSEELSSKKS